MGKSITCLGVLACLMLAAAPDCRGALPQADKVLVLKSEQNMLLLKNGEVLKSYRVALGRQPVGHKLCQGDCRTPEGTYILDHRNSHSKFYRSIHISYPNSTDIARAKKKGTSAGKDIMIHGLPKGFEDLGDVHTARNWTKGCIAVSNDEIDEIWRLVPDGTPIEIKP